METKKLALVTFVKPTQIKLLFLVEWLLFIIISLMRGHLVDSQQILVAVYPLLIFYFIACVLTAFRHQKQQLAKG